MLCTLEHKLQLLNDLGVDLVIVLPFTKEFSEQSATTFLQSIRKHIPFDSLILGSDAHIGKNREGDSLMVTALAEALKFDVQYFPDYTKQGQRISSSLIRDCVKKGLLKDVEEFLGRPYSICGSVLKGAGRGEPLGFHTANLAVENLCLPPLGVYAVSLTVEGKTFLGVANLGFAPTFRNENDPILEVHVFNQHFDLYGKIVDVRFYDFIREEKCFSGIEDLRKQIAEDVKTAKLVHEKSCYRNNA